MKAKVTIAMILMAMGSASTAQKLQLVRIELEKQKMMVFYQLDDANPNHEYQVSLYSSKDNFAVPLTKVSGDIGQEVKAGAEKKIEWNMIDEIGTYSGEISIEVRARVFVPFVKIQDFDVDRNYRRGKSYPLGWTSGNMGGHLDIELFEGQKRIPIERNVPNTGKYELFIPPSVSPGNDYKLKLTNTRNRDEFIELGPIRITPRVPLVAKVGAVAAVGAGVYVIITMLGPDKEDPLDTPPTLPEVD